MILRRFLPERDLSINQCRLPESRSGAKKEPGRLAWQPPGLFLCNIYFVLSCRSPKRQMEQFSYSAVPLKGMDSPSTDTPSRVRSRSFFSTPPA